VTFGPAGPFDAARLLRVADLFIGGIMATAGDERVRTGEVLWWVLVSVVAAVALLLAVAGILLPATGASSDGSSGTPGGGAGGSTTMAVELGDLYVKPSSVEVAAGQTLVLQVTNKGAMSHDLKVEGTNGTDLLAPGASATVEVGPFDQSTQAWCTVPGHKAAGMVMDIVVSDAADGAATGGSAAAAGTTSGHDMAMSPTGMGGTSNAVIDPQAVPAEGWTARDPMLAPALEGTVHEVALAATEDEIEVAPGVTQQMWTFNGTVPGPILHVKLGDTVRVTLTNEGKLGHSIDFHASEVAWNDEMRTIQPGESLVYEFHADHAGIYMYHCGTAPALHHIGNGMYGAIVVDPPDLAPVDGEFAIVQSELYLGPQGQPGDLTKMQSESFDAVVFNGFSNQYKFQPIPVEPGKRYRIWVLDAGPNENSAFHVVGTIFDTVWKEGAYLLRPDDTHGGSQVLDLQPAQGGFVELTFAEDGLYPMVTHKFANVGKGALGLFAAGDAGDAGAAGH